MGQKQLNVLLAEAPFSYQGAIVKGERYFPLGIGYIASYIRRISSRKVGVFLGELDEFEQTLKKDPPDVLGISSMTNTYPAGAEMARRAKKCNPDGIIIFGGQHASGMGSKLLQDIPEADFICIGEGEILMDQLLAQIESGAKQWDKIPGLVYRTPDGFKENLPAVLNSEIESLPFPARDLADISIFKSHGQMRFGGLTASMITSRGCPWNCTYCSSHITMGKKYRFLSAEYVLSEIEELYHKYNVRNLVFWDDLLTFDHDRLTEICQGMIDRKLKINWFCQSRTDRITLDVARIMKKAGCRMISFGVESGNENTLKRIRKNVKLDVVLNSISLCKKAGIRTQGTFILGLPWETRQEMMDTIDFSLKSKLDLAIFFSFTPYPGTHEWQSVPEELKPKNIKEWDTFVCNNRVGRTWNSNLNEKEMKVIISKAHWKFYMRPVQVFRILKSVHSIMELFGIIQNACGLIYSIFSIRVSNFVRTK